jgi:intracellular multiplication protein IcmK
MLQNCKALAVAAGVMCAYAAHAQTSAQLGPSPNVGGVQPAQQTPGQQALPNQQAGQVLAGQIPPLPAGITASAPRPGEGLSPEAFAALVNGQLPLNASQVKEVNKQLDSVKRARSARVGPAPRPVSVTARVTLAAGANPHVLRLSPDTVTSVVFTDVTGAPWTVLRVVSGAKELEIPKEFLTTKTNMFTIMPTDDYVSTNIAVFLDGAPAPVMMAVETNQREVDFRVDVSVQARGPGAVAPVISRGLVDSVSADLTSMVAGVTPAQAKPLKVLASDVPDVQAWVLGKRMYVRARANVLAPPVPKDGKVATGADGTKVYELPLAPEVLLMQGGNVGRLRLGGFPPPALPVNTGAQTVQAAAGQTQPNVAAAAR